MSRPIWLLAYFVIAACKHQSAPTAPLATELVSVDAGGLGSAAGPLGEPQPLGARTPLHERSIVGLVVTPDGTTAYAAGLFVDDAEQQVGEKGELGVRVWDLTTGTQRATIGHVEARLFAATPGGSVLAVLDPAGTLHVWGSDGVVHGTVAIGANVVWIGLDADGTTARAVDATGTVTTWDVRTGQQRSAIATHVAASCAAAAAALVVLGTKDGGVEVVDLASGRVKPRLAAMDGRVNGVAVSRDGTRVVAIGEHGGATCEVSGNCAPFAQSGVRVLILSDDQRAVVTSPTQGQELFVVDLASGSAKPLEGDYSIALAEVSGVLVTGTWGGAIRTIDLASGKQRMKSPGHAGMVSVLGFASDDALVSSSRRGLRWPRGSTNPTELPQVLAISPSGDSLVRDAHDGVTIDRAGRAKELKLASRAEQSALGDHVYVAVTTDWGDGPGEDTSMVHVFDLDTGSERTWSPEMHVQVAAISPDGATIVLGGDAVAVYARATGKRDKTLLGDTLNVSDLKFTPDGKQLIVSSESHGVQIWDPATGTLVRTLYPGERGKPQGSGNTAYAIAIAPNGERIASGHRDGTLILWEAGTGRELGRARRHHTIVSSAAFSHDGAQLATADGAGQVLLWPVAK